MTEPSRLGRQIDIWIDDPLGFAPVERHERIDSNLKPGHGNISSPGFLACDVVGGLADQFW
ncbi:MAG TPA: hypothetical protein VL068_11175, partial [Microthrixaceae bacterium]|nr:hypothetical protein [Microthrixaceae bacterium]